MTAVSGVTAFSTLIVGTIGVILIIFGGQAILAGRMTPGDLVMYMILTGLVAMPLIEIANIGTQIFDVCVFRDAFRKLIVERRRFEFLDVM